MDQKRAVWVADVADREALARLLRVALLHGVAAVNLAESHVGAGVHILQIRLRGQPVVVLTAELAGETATGSFALRLAPLDPSHIPELTALASRVDDSMPPPGPMSARASAIFDTEPPLRPPPPRAQMKTDPFPAEVMPTGLHDGKFTSTVVDPEPEEVTENDLDASVLFDPEAALISRAPARPEGTGPDDTLTIPLRASMIPAGMSVPGVKSPPPPRRPPSGPHTISHLSIPTTAPITDPSELDDPIDVVEGSATNEPYVMTRRQGSSGVEGTLSVTVDFDTSQSNVHTERGGLWDSGDGPNAADASLAGSVVFDPDILAREQRIDPNERANDRPAAHPAEDEGYSVVFGTEATSPGAVPQQSSPPRRVGVVVAGEDLSLTPTVPIEIPPRRPPARSPARAPSARREPPVRKPTRRGPPLDRTEESVNDEAATYPRESERPVMSRDTASSGRGPRTQRRITGPVDVVVPGRIIANRYRIESLVGAGAVGAVYKASHVDLPRTFAIKVLHPHYRTDAQLLASFRTEARAASLLDHPNVTVVHDFGEEPDGLVYIVMEYLPGVNLQTILDEARRLEPRRAIAIMLQVCGALMAAHERGIVHRDVKPDNIMLIASRDDEGRSVELVKVCDFGIAALETAPDAADPEWTAGTPEYMAPEQVNGRADVRTDVYACGVVLYEMLTGRPPFVGESPIATLAKHVKEVARRPSELVPGLPLPLEAVIGRAMEKAPERRFQTIRDLRIALKRLL